MKNWELRKGDEIAIIGYGPGAPTHLTQDGWTLIGTTDHTDTSILSLVEETDDMGEVRLVAVIDPDKVQAKERRLAEVHESAQAAEYKRLSALQQIETLQAKLDAHDVDKATTVAGLRAILKDVVELTLAKR